MQPISYRQLNGGYYALLIDGEEIGTVYKKEHAEQIETTTFNFSKLEARVESLTLDNEELENRVRHLTN